MIDDALMQPLSKDRFKFSCRRTLPCFTKCCANLDLILTPYDVIRLKSRLNMASGDFLKKYTSATVDDAYGVPAVKLKMNTDEMRRCPFVSQEGCTVYEDRPGACRIYPLGRAASKAHKGLKTGEYYFVVKESHCLGFDEEKEWEIRQWVADQELDLYNEMNDYFLEITAGKTPRMIKKLNDSQLKMFYTACYSLNEFRRFIFGSTFLERFDIERDVIQRIETDDVELMKFSSRWLKFSLFGEKTLTFKS